MFSSKLYQALINDRTQHPERLNATLERVEEVIAATVRDEALARRLSTLCGEGISDRRAYLTPEQGKAIATVFGENCDASTIRLVTELLMDSEVATQEAIDLHEAFKIPVSHLEKDIIPIRGDGAWIVANDGRAYLDMDSNYSANNLGMCNQEVALGIFNQASQLLSTKEDRVHVPRARFLKNIHDMMPEGLTHFYWQNSGGEAVDKSLKIAKAYTQNKGVIAMKGGFHGRTHGAVAVTYEIKYREPFFLHEQDWVHFVEYNDADAIEQIMKEGKARTVILELVQGEEAGIRPAERSFAKRVREICDRYNGVMIVDEIQTGFGRTAEKEGQWFACQVYDVIPDIITIGKSFGGGYPVTAVVTKKKISDAMKNGYDGSTFGGNPMAMVAAMIATRQMRERNITGNVVARSRQLMDGLRKLKEKHTMIGEIRGLGLMNAFQLPTPAHVLRFQQRMADNGVLTSLSTREWVRFLPLLIMTEEEVNFLLNAIDKSLTNLD